MYNVRGDSLIKRLRKEKDLTQEQLSEGICSVEHLIKIENGQRAPGRGVFKSLMERLGENPNKYYTDLVTLEDRRVVKLKDNLSNLLHKYTEQSNQQADELIKTLEEDDAFKIADRAFKATDEDFKARENQQFLLISKAGLALNRENYADLYKYAMEALIKTKSDFDVDKIDTYFLSHHEIWLVNQVGIACFFIDTSIERSTNIFRKLKIIIEKGCIEGDMMIHIYAALLYNLSKNLGILGEFDECLEVCDKGLEWCARHRESYRHPMIMFHKVCCLLSLGDKVAGIALLERTYAFFKALGRNDELQQIKNYVESQFQIAIANLNI